LKFEHAFKKELFKKREKESPLKSGLS